MKDSSSKLEIGEIVEIIMGRDKGNYAVVINKIDERFVEIVDGDKRKFDISKKKNIRHLKPTGYISKEIVVSMETTSRVSNAKLRYVLQDFVSNHLNKEKKGE